LATAWAAQRPITSENQGGTSKACQTGSNCCDHRDHISTGQNDNTAMPSRRSSPSESRQLSDKGRYATTQCRQEAENSPATTREFNHMLNMAVNEVRQPRTDEETSSAYVRHRAAQGRLSQSAPMLCERVKAEPVAPPPVDSAYSRGHQLREEFRDCVVLQHLRLSNLQADGHTPVPDQGVIFDQNGIPQDSHDLRLRCDPTHEPTEPGSPPLEYRDGPDGDDGGDGSDPSSHGDS
jgi:hypothetical protein